MVAAPMPAARSSTSCVIGVDLGGTKLLAGVVGPDLAVRHRIRRQAFGLDQARLMATIVEAVEEARAEVEDEVAAVGFGIPVTLDRRTGMAVYSTHLPLADVPFGAVMSERLGLPVTVDNDGNCAVLAEARHGAGGGSGDVVMLTLGTGIGGGLVLGGKLQRGWIGAGAELGHMVIDMDGPPCQGHCPNRGCLEVMASGSALVREASLRVARRPDTALGHALEEGRELTGPFVTELAHDGDPVARDALETVGRALGVGLSTLVNLLNPEVIVIGGGVIAAGEMLLEPARREMRERALAPGARRGPGGRGRVRRAGGDDRRGADGARGGVRRAPVSGRLVVCPTPIGNLEDITLRVLSALRDADVVACEDTRRTGVLLERYGVQAKLVPYHEHNERERSGRPRRADARRRGRRARLRRRHAARLRSRLRARAGLRRGGAGGRGAARAVGGAGGARRLGAAGRRLALRRLPPAQARRARRGVLGAGDARRVRVAEAGGGVARGARRARSRRARWRSAAS